MPTKSCVHDSGYEVCTIGEGSDEILAGYSHARQDLLRAEQIRSKNRIAGMGERKKTQLLMLHQILPAAKSVQQTLGFIPSCG